MQPIPISIIPLRLDLRASEGESKPNLVPICSGYHWGGSPITQGGGLVMLRQCSHWPIRIVPRSGEGTGSRLPLTGEPRECYLLILGTELLIWHKGGNSGRRTVFGSTATPVRGSKSYGKLVCSSKRPVFGRSPNNPGLLLFSRFA
jgi:hypothetical protein